MAPVAVAVERRGESRCAACDSRWQSDAVLRPGQSVTVLNISSRAALLESSARLRPGAHTEMQLASAGARMSIRGRLDRCHVVALEPLRYRGVLMFDQRFNLEGDAGAGRG